MWKHFLCPCLRPFLQRQLPSLFPFLPVALHVPLPIDQVPALPISYFYVTSTKYLTERKRRKDWFRLQVSGGSVCLEWTMRKQSSWHCGKQEAAKGLTHNDLFLPASSFLSMLSELPRTTQSGCQASNRLARGRYFMFKVEHHSSRCLDGA